MSSPFAAGNLSYGRDFSKPEEANKVLAHLGGEPLLKEKFPKVYQAFLNTVVKHKNIRLSGESAQIEEDVIGLKNSVYAGPISLRAIGKAALEGQLGDENTYNGEAEGQLTGMSSVQVTEDWISAYVSGSVKCEADGETIHTFCEKIESTNSYEMVQHQSVNDLTQFDNQTLINGIECTWVQQDNTLMSLMAENRTFVLNGLSSTIEDMTIDDPKSLVGNNPIRIMYARKPDKSEMIDYIYPDNKTISGSDLVKMLFPVKGKITFKDELIPMGYNADLSKALPTLKIWEKGVCTYNYSQEEIASCFRISSTNPQVMEFQLKDDWKSILEMSCYESCNRYGNIRFEFSFYITAKIRDTETVINQAVSIYSTEILGEDQMYYDSKDDCMVLIPPINISWGCFGKNTRILMADRSEKIVSEMLCGDRILGEAGCVLEVQNIVSGHEENLYTICTKGGKELEVTGSHPVATKTGAIRAKNITPSTVLLCEDGREDEVEFNYMKPYNDTVYNIQTGDGSNWLVANGILAGNFDMQNELIEPVMAKKLISDETLQLKAEFDKLVDYLKGL